MQNLKQTMRHVAGRALRSLEEREVTSAAAKSLRRAYVNWQTARVQAAEATMQAEVAPLVEIPYPPIDLSAVRDPLPAIYAAPELTAANEHLCRATPASQSLVSAVSQALLYTLVRNLKPDHVFEIGTYKAGTAEVICRALHFNGRGTLHTTDPFGEHRVPPIVARWPNELSGRLRFYPLDSMAFYGAMTEQRHIRPDLVFVDGNHDYEYALFDIALAARLLRLGGFVVIDNIVQPGPYLAARDFLAAHPDWIECRVDDRAYDPTRPYDGERSNIPYTEFMILRAPAGYSIGGRPTSFGEVPLRGSGMGGVMLPLGQPPEKGVVHVQCVLRGFSTTKPNVEYVDAVFSEVSPRDAGAVIRLPIAMDVGSGFEQVRLEIWLTWTGTQPLPLKALPFTC